MSKRISDILDLAIKREEEAYEFYTDILGRVSDETAIDTLKFVAGEEIKHKRFLVNYREGKYGAGGLRMADVVEYRIAEYLEEPDIEGDMSSQDVYLIAAHRESRSHQFYSELAGLHADGEIQSMLVKMANEELKHKEKMEYLYSNTAFTQTSGG